MTSVVLGRNFLVEFDGRVERAGERGVFHDRDARFLSHRADAQRDGVGALGEADRRVHPLRPALSKISPGPFGFYAVRIESVRWIIRRVAVMTLRFASYERWASRMSVISISGFTLG